MNDLRAQLQEILQGRICVVGVGNLECGDDGFGVRLAEALQKSEIRNPKSETNPKHEIRSAAAQCNEDGSSVEVIIAGTTPENYLSLFTAGGFDNVIFLDAVEFGGEPGAVVLLNSTEIAARFPQISTHKLSLGLLAKLVEASGNTKAWLLGVQLESLKEGTSLSPKVQASLELLTDLLAEVAQTFSLLYRRLPVGQPSELPSASGLEIRDTAEWNSALHLLAAKRASRISGFGFRTSDFPFPC